MVLRDQVPVSQNEEIEVELKNKSAAEYNKETGILTWRFNLPAGEKATREFSYTVRYPKDKGIRYY